MRPAIPFAEQPVELALDALERQGEGHVALDRPPIG
jgi:hypothetical protein